MTTQFGLTILTTLFSTALGLSDMQGASGRQAEVQPSEQTAQPQPDETEEEKAKKKKQQQLKEEQEREQQRLEERKAQEREQQRLEERKAQEREQQRAEERKAQEREQERLGEREQQAREEQRAEERKAQEREQERLGEREQQQREAQRLDERQQQEREQQRLEERQQEQRAEQRLEERQQQQRADQRQEKRLSQQEQQLRIQQQQQRLAVYRQNIGLREELAQRNAQVLRQQNRLQHLRFQEQYEERLRLQQAQLNQARYDYTNDPFYYTAPNYRYRRDGRDYQTNQYGIKKLDQALQAGYNEGYKAGRADREDHWRNDYRSAFAYQDANYGYDGRYIAQDEYNHYFREGFQRGYDDGYYSRQKYGKKNDSGGINDEWLIAGAVVAAIIGYQVLKD